MSQPGLSPLQRRGFVFLFLGAMMASMALPLHAQPEKKILLLNSYSYDMVWTRSITEAVSTIFGETEGVRPGGGIHGYQAP